MLGFVIVIQFEYTHYQIVANGFYFNSQWLNSIFLGTDKEKFLFQPADKIYEKVGKDLVSSSASVELFVFPSQYSDLASMAHVCHLTGGTCYRYPVSNLQLLKHTILNEHFSFSHRKRIKHSSFPI